MRNMSLTGRGGKYLYSKKGILGGPMTLTYKYHLKSLQPSDHRHTVSEVKARLDQSERRHSPDKIFMYNFVFLYNSMTLT